jgi:hypothetical protein
MTRSTVLRVVECAKFKTEAGLGGGEGQGNRLKVAHFADQNNIGILWGGFEAGGSGRMLGNLALCDNAPFVPMNEFDGLSMVMMWRERRCY